MTRVKARVVGLTIACVALTGCGPAQRADSGQTPEPPAYVSPLPGAGLKQVVLTAQAADRIGIKTEPVREAPSVGVGSTAVPVAALVYDKTGQTWVFAMVGLLTYVRERVTLARLDGDNAILSSGPAVGTPVVTVGMSELLGAEDGVAGE